MLRPYQQEAHDRVIQWITKSKTPCMIEAATGAGKSHIIAEIATTIHRISNGKHVLCLAPSAELVIQNSEKYGATGNPFSLFSASAGKISLRHPVVFGTPLTVKNRIEKFGSQFAMIVIDECHGITPTVKGIVDAMREQNANLRVVGMTATPYRFGSGYIFRQWADGNPVGEKETKDPYFASCVHRITARELIDQGYLTVPILGAIRAESYHTLGMELNSRGQFDAADVDRAYIGQGRKTAAIIADVVSQSRDRQGVMIFAATVQHAYECIESLPAGLSAIVTGDTPREERSNIIARFKAREIKYIVNVSVLTTGFDAPHVDVIAILRATESVGLLQQIIGRGLRLYDGKEDCLLLDYAENIERHCPDGDVFDPKIRVTGLQSEGLTVKCRCPDCNKVNEFKARINDEGYNVDDAGYFCDLNWQRIPSEFGDIPAHHGRRCQGWLDIKGGDQEQCRYRWTHKECPHCNGENDIAARYCIECKGEIVDPNEKLRIEFQAMKADPTRRQTDKVIGWEVRPTLSRAGRPMIKVDVTTPHRAFSYWVPKEPNWAKGVEEKMRYEELGGNPPLTITYQKDANGWYKVFAYNRKPDEIPGQH